MKNLINKCHHDDRRCHFLIPVWQFLSNGKLAIHPVFPLNTFGKSTASQLGGNTAQFPKTVS